jgi:hypothetical protein
MATTDSQIQEAVDRFLAGPVGGAILDKIIAALGNLPWDKIITALITALINKWIPVTPPVPPIPPA